MGRPVKLFKQFRSTLRYMQLDPTKVFSYPSVAWVRINRTKLKIVFFWIRLWNPEDPDFPVDRSPRCPSYIVPVLLIRCPVGAVCRVQQFVTLYIVSVSSWITLSCNCAQQMQASKVNLPRWKSRSAQKKKNSCKSIVLKRRYTIKQVGIKFNLPHDILCPSPRLSIDIQERSKARKRC